MIKSIDEYEVWYLRFILDMYFTVVVRSTLKPIQSAYNFDFYNFHKITHKDIVLQHLFFTLLCSCFSFI